MHIHTTVQLEVLVEKTFANFVVFGLVKDLGGGQASFFGDENKIHKRFLHQILIFTVFSLENFPLYSMYNKTIGGKK